LSDILKKEDSDGLARFTISELYPVIDPVSGKFSDLVDVQLKVAKQEYDNSSRMYHQSKAISIAAIILGVLLSSGLGLMIVRSITTPLAAGVVVANRLAQGDLTVEVEVFGRDETGQLMTAMRAMTENFRTIISQVSSTSSQVASAATQLNSTAEHIATGAEEVAAQTGTVATAGEEMSATSGDIAQNCQMAAEGAERASQAAQNGAEVVDATIAVMGQIAD